MKKMYLIVLLLIMANAFFVGVSAMDSSAERNNLGLNDIETLSDGTESCWSGGYGAKSCSISAGVHWGFGISTGCSVSCEDNYYACCALRCHCVFKTPYAI